MQIAKPLTITTTIGTLTVIVSPDKANWYVGDNASASIGWSPVSGNSCTLVIDWGDGIVDTKTVMTPGSHIHKYTTAKVPYTVKATVTDNTSKATGSGSGTLNVVDVLTATFTSSPSPATGAAPLTVAFTFNMSGGYAPLTWTLNFGDGSTVLSNPTSPQSHVYTEGDKTYTAILTVTDALGVSLSWMLEIGAGIVPPELVPWLEVAAASIPLLVVVGTIVAQELKRLGINY